MKSNKKSNRILWGLVALVVLITLAVSFGTMSSHSQRDNSKKQDNQDNEDLSKYAVVNYNAPEPENDVEREERKLKNSRYDNQLWVHRNPHPDTGGVGRFDEKIPPPLFPADDSDLVVVGEIVNVSAHLSNDKTGVYSEFKIRVGQILKNDLSKEIKQGDFITTDRAGGLVHYPNGQKVIYKHSERDLLYVGNEYLLFLKRDDKSPNYEILTGYELKESDINLLDSGRRFDDFKRTGKLKFVEIVRNKIAESLTDKETRRKP